MNTHAERSVGREKQRERFIFISALVFVLYSRIPALPIYRIQEISIEKHDLRGTIFAFHKVLKLEAEFKITGLSLKSLQVHKSFTSSEFLRDKCVCQVASVVSDSLWPYGL